MFLRGAIYLKKSACQKNVIVYTLSQISLILRHALACGWQKSSNLQTDNNNNGT